MQLSKLKTALSGLARKPESTLVISPSLSLHIGSIDTSNTQYLQRQTEFLRNNPTHSAVADSAEFFKRLWRRELSADIVQYLANVVITGWTLLDDDGKQQSFSTGECIDLLTLPDGIGASIAVAVIDHAVTQTNYALDWESVVTKNS
jgi:hypothetical protein